MNGQPFTLRMLARPDAVTTARHELAKIAFAYGVDSFAVKTVVSELVGNVVRHAYGGSEPRTVVVTAAPTDDLLLITVADDGGGMRPRMRDERDGLGLGLALSARLTEELRIESDERGTTVYASFRIPPKVLVHAARRSDADSNRLAVMPGTGRVAEMLRLTGIEKLLTLV